jgi:3-deoxy-D-manno-octulosonic-acid transferase
MPTLLPEGFPLATMVARHGDAEFIGRALEGFDISLIRGAGAGERKRDRGGVAALRGAVAALEDGRAIAMTADVPPGPARKAGLGIITLARLSGRPIVPVGMASSRNKVLNTWSRFTINLPYSRLSLVVGEPILVDETASSDVMEQRRQLLEAELDRLTRRAWVVAGSDPGRIYGDASNAARPGWRLRTYGAAMSLAGAGAGLALAWRQRQGKEDPARRDERLGIGGTPRPDGPLAWFHAASIGETNAVLPVIRALGVRRPDLRLLLTTGTVTSADLAKERLPEGAIHQYVPLDVPAYVARFLDHWQPDLALFTESEIWPSLILDASRRGIPICLLNARLSPRSFARWRRRPDVARPLFERLDLVLAQNEKLARRFAELGARHALSVGNLKIDAPAPPINPSALAALRTAIDGRPLLIAASTHSGEDEVIASAHGLLAAQRHGFMTIIAPRHPDRGPSIVDMLRARGLGATLRSKGALPDRTSDIYVADTIGELGTLYALGPLAFVGGSLVEHGGQNPIEAVRHGAAVLTGPHWHNFHDEYRAMLRYKGALEVRSASDLAEAVGRLMSSPAELDAMRAGARTALESLSGALERTLDAIFPHLPEERARAT